MITPRLNKKLENILREAHKILPLSSDYLLLGPLYLHIILVVSLKCLPLTV